MINKYITRPDKNGNVYRLIIDHTKKLIYYGFSCPLFARSEAITTNKKELQNIRQEAKEAGYTEK